MMFMPIAPDMFTVTTDFKEVMKTQPLRPGLNYYFHSDASPTKQAMLEVLRAMTNDLRFAGMRSQQFTDMLGDLAWRRFPALAAERDRLEVNGFNYVGRIGRHVEAPMFWGQTVNLSSLHYVDLGTAVMIFSILHHLTRDLAYLYRGGYHLHGRDQFLHYVQEILNSMRQHILGLRYTPVDKFDWRMQERKIFVQTSFHTTAAVPYAGAIVIDPQDRMATTKLVLDGIFSMAPNLVNTLYSDPIMDAATSRHVLLEFRGGPILS